MKYRKKPVVIEAERWTGQEHPSVLANRGDRRTVMRGAGYKVPVDAGCGLVFTPEGPVQITPGDWLVHGVKGDPYPVKDDIFRATYEAVGLPEIDES